MKQITTYISEKANFIVKKHVNNNKMFEIAMSVDELKDGCYAKYYSEVKRAENLYIIKYSDSPNDNDKVGFYWVVNLHGKYRAWVRTKGTRFCGYKSKCTFTKLTKEDYKIIEYMEAHSDEFKDGKPLELLEIKNKL